jgi:signal transduction histidine kinase
MKKVPFDPKDESFLSSLCSRIASISGAFVCALTQYDHHQRRFITTALHGLDHPVIKKAQKLFGYDPKDFDVRRKKGSFLEKIYNTKKYLVFNDLYTLVNKKINPVVCKTIEKVLGFRQAIVIPIIVNDQVTGTISCVSKESIQNIPLLETFAHYIGLAIHEAELISMFRRLADLSISLPADEDSAIHAIMASAGENFGGSYVIFARMDRHRKTMVIERAWNAPSGLLDRPEFSFKGSISSHILQMKRPLVSYNPRKDMCPQCGKPLNEDPIIRKFKVKSYLGTPILDDQGKAIGTLCIVNNERRNITSVGLELLIIYARLLSSYYQRKLAKIREQSLNQQLVLSERMSSLGVFASGIAHEFNNIVGLMQGYAEMYLLQPETITDKALANTIIKQTKRASEITNRLLRFSRSQAKKIKSPVHIHEIINDLLKMMAKDFFDKRISKEINIREIPKVMFDPVDIQQVFLNLIYNAIHAMKNQGTLTIDAGTSKDNSSVVIKISDTGRGIPEKDIKRIFTPFYTTKLSGNIKGTGLGLSIAYRIVKSYRGNIEVKSAPDRGTTFTVTLPLILPEKKKQT